MNAILSLIGPYLIRALSSTAARAVGVAVARCALDFAAEQLREAGHDDAAVLIRDIESALFADPAPLVRAAQQALLAAPTVSDRA